MFALMFSFLALWTAQDAQYSLVPNPPIAGGQVTVSVPAAAGARTLVLASPFGAWRVVQDIPAAGGAWKVALPQDLPLLLISVTAGDDLVVPHQIVDVVAADGSPAKRGAFWKALLLAGYPTPYPPAAIDAAAALTAAREALRREPAFLPAQELIWRIEAQMLKTADERAAWLKTLDAGLGAAPEGRLALAASRIHLQLADTAGAKSIETRYRERILPVLQAEEKRWQDILGTSAPRSQSTKIHAWLAEDPLSSYAGLCTQILAATYAAVDDYPSTAIFGLASLRMTPDDAMTLNGVAYAMAEGNFMLERGLALADRAVSILRNPARLQRPPQLSETRWLQELTGALAASLDTRGWLLTRMQRWQEAESAFREAISLGEKDEFYYHYGLMLKGAGRIAEARGNLEKGLRMAGPMRERISIALDQLGR